MPFSSHGHNYSPLDDTEEFDTELSLNQLTDDDDDTYEEDARWRWFHLSTFRFRLFQLSNKVPKPGKTIVDLAACIACLITVLSVCLSLGYYTVLVHKPAPLIDKSYRAFRIPNHRASLNYGAFQNVKRNHTPFLRISHKSLQQMTKGQGLFGRHVRSAEIPVSRVKRHPTITQETTQYYPLWKMQVIFLSKDGQNIFTKERLKFIHNVELNIMKHEKYPEFCFKDIHPAINNDPAVKAYNGCAPLNSLLTYFYPSRDNQGNIFYDGLGENMDNLESGLKLAMMSTNFYYYVDEKVNSTNLKSELLRTEVLFGAPLKGFEDPNSYRELQNRKFKEFVVTYIDVLSKSSTEDITVLYGGKEIFDYEVEVTFWNDVKLAVYAVVAIFLLILVLTSGSVWLTVWGLISILLSAPLAIFFYRVVFNVVGLGILNGAAAFVIIGIGVDDVFVFINVFRQADHLKDARARTLFTVRTAGIATFFTSFTTAAAFAANIASMIPAVHDFGLFMFLIVANCWLTVILVMPPVLYIWYRSVRLCEERISGFLCTCCRYVGLSTRYKLPDEVAHFMDPSHGSLTSATLTREVTDEDADVPMLSFEASNLYVDDEEDEEMIHVDPDPLYIPEDVPRDETKKSGNLGTTLQALMYHFMALPFIKTRYVIIGLSVAILCVSVGFMSQLHTSTKPPQFFRSTTNMQQLLDLKAKFSAIDTMQCLECSAIYSIGQKRAPPTPVTRTTHLTRHPTTSLGKTTRASTSTSEPVHTVPYHQETWPPTPLPHLTPRHEPPHLVTTHRPIPHRASTVKPKSVPEDYDVCKDHDCSHPKKRPMLESGATVYVVLGVKEFKWTVAEMAHVMTEDMGQLTFDKKFQASFNFTNPDISNSLREMCIVCKRIAKNKELVRNGSAECLPMNNIPVSVKQLLLGSIAECKNLPEPTLIYGNQQPAHALGSLTKYGTGILWLSFAFESTTSKGKSYFEAYQEYQKWEEFLREIKKDLDPNSPLQDMFQTSEFWPEVLMEIVAVDSAIYSVVLSLVICMVAVMIFTRHVLLLLIIMISIIEMVCVVVAIFYILGWEIGGVEAISLSILVGSSVDYCVHLAEGYMLAASACPVKDSASAARQWRTSAAFSHIGVSIVSSALTTIIAALPLTQTTIQPFAKFGQIIAINTSVCIVYSLTVCTALLATIAPAFFKPNWKTTVKVVLGTIMVVGSVILVMFIMAKASVNIPGPNGGALFSS